MNSQRRHFVDSHASLIFSTGDIHVVKRAVCLTSKHSVVHGANCICRGLSCFREFATDLEKEGLLNANRARQRHLDSTARWSRHLSIWGSEVGV